MQIRKCDVYVIKKKQFNLYVKIMSPPNDDKVDGKHPHITLGFALSCTPDICHPLPQEVFAFFSAIPYRSSDRGYDS